MKFEKMAFKSGRYSFSVLTYGAVLYSFGTEDFNAVLNHKDLYDYVDDPSYMGKVIGPVANRIKNAEFTLDGEKYELDKNDGENNLHSGSACFGNAFWDVKERTDSSVVLSLDTADGLGGFPGNHHSEVEYCIFDDGTLRIKYRISSDRKCPVSVTNHSYFNLGGGTVLSHFLTLDAEEYVDSDSSLIPTEVLSVEGTDFDFRKGSEISEKRGGVFDNTFITKKAYCVGRRASLEVNTQEVGIHVYTGGFLSGDHIPFEGICFESGRYPDTPNRPDFPQAHTERGRIYETATDFRLEVF